MELNLLERSEILGLPDKIIEQAKANTENDYLYSKSETKKEKYNYREMRSDIKSCIDKFKDTNLYYNSLISYRPKASTINSINEWVKYCKKGDPFSKLIDKRTDDLIWAREFYYYIYDVAKQLTLDEAIYFVDDFFKGKTEDNIARELGMSKTTLTEVKRSCLIKVSECLEFFVRNTY